MKHLTPFLPSPLPPRYGNTHPIVFVERKTHKESWKGEESVKERFLLAEDKVVPFLDGTYAHSFVRGPLMLYV